jgi:hypothetical protein
MNYFYVKSLEAFSHRLSITNHSFCLLQEAPGMQFTVYALPSSLSAGVLLALLLYIFIRRRNAIGAAAFLLLAFSGWVWACGNALFLMSLSMQSKIFWFNLSQFGPDFSPVFWLALALVYTGQKQLAHKMRIAWLFVLPLITTVLMWTNDFHHLLRTGVRLIPLDFARSLVLGRNHLRLPNFLRDPGHPASLLAFIPL